MIVYLVFWRNVLEEIFLHEEKADEYIRNSGGNPDDYSKECWVVRNY